jgi:hypothetical protein
MGSGMDVTRNVKWHTLVALVLAAGVAIALVALAVAAAIAESSQHKTLSEAAATLLSTSLGASIGAVATYLGTRPSEPSAPDTVESGGAASPTVAPPYDHESEGA